jgi:hypothetical protein
MLLDKRPDDQSLIRDRGGDFPFRHHIQTVHGAHQVS